MAEIKYFDSPKIKGLDEIKKGDIFKTQYGYYNNYVKIVFEKHEVVEMNWLKTTGHYIDGNYWDGYECMDHPIKYEVVGEEK